MGWRDSANIVQFNIYDSSGQLVASVDGDGFTVYGTGAYVNALIKLGLATGAPTITFRPPPIVGHPYTDGTLTVGSDATLGPYVDIRSPKETGKQITTFTIRGEGDASHPPTVVMATDFFSTAGVLLAECDWQNNLISQPRGFRGGTFLTSDSAPIGVTETAVHWTTTQMVFRNNRVYEIRLAGVLAAAGTTGTIMRMRKGQTTAGALILDFGVTPTGGAFTPPPAPAMFANTTGADITSNLVVTCQVGGGSTQWLGNSTRPSGFSIWDVGDANQMTGKAPFSFIT
jgi:hypothetical protein